MYHSGRAYALRYFMALMVLVMLGNVAYAGETPGVPPEVVAEYIHALVQANRTLYTTHVVERLQELGITVPSEHWKTEGTLPLPAQMLLMTGWEVEGQGTGLRIRLVSRWPINHTNSPADEFERAGLEQVGKTPHKPYTGIITQGNKRVFKALYPDRAVSTVCIDCHNHHESSAKRNYKLNDVMGGVVVSFPLH